MTRKQHLIIAIVFFALLAFELIAYTSILGHPYMVALCLFLGCIGGFNLGSFFIKHK